MKGRGYDAFRLIVGEGLVTAEGEDWRRQRRLLSPAFHERATSGYLAPMRGEIELSRERLARAAALGTPIDAGEEMARLSMGIVTRTVLGLEVESQCKVDRAMRSLFAWLDERHRSPLHLPHWVPTRENRAFMQTKASLDVMFRRAIEERRRGEGGSDLCERIVRAHDDDGIGRGEKPIIDELFTLFLAGYETTGRTLAWALYHLSESPELAARLAEEARSAGPLEDPRSLLELRETSRFLSEILRLYPPAWLILRDAVEDDELGGVHVPAGTTVLVPILLTHRHPDFWPNPEQFDPSRFSPENIAGRHRSSYLPFSLGTRMCIGNHFALQEMLLAIAMLAPHFHFELWDADKPKPVGDSLLAPSKPMRMRVRMR